MATNPPTPLPVPTPTVELSTMTLADVASICHEANRAYCIALKDYSQKPWPDAGPEIQYSAKHGVKFLLAHFVQKRIPPPWSLHDSWAAQKVKDGWKFGLIKDPVAKTHPCLVPFDQLPHAQQVKDFIFHGVVMSLFSSGVQIELEKIEKPSENHLHVEPPKGLIVQGS